MRRRLLLMSAIVPEASSSAAGVRTMNLLRMFREKGYEAFVGVPKKEENSLFVTQLREIGVECLEMMPNRSEETKVILKEKVRPDVAVFDQFILEEMFGFQIRDLFPDCLRVVDTQDIHCLRLTRQHAILKQGKSIREAFESIPSTQDERFLREVASIYRSDLNLLVGTAELQMLTQKFNIPAHKFGLAPLLFNVGKKEMLPSFDERANFVTIGNFRHPPNKDSVHWLHDEVWPLIRKHHFSKKRPEMHIYGAYMDSGSKSLTNAKRDFFVHGHLANLKELAKYRVMLSPLRFGAGVKGKIVDAWSRGIPVVTTPVGGESMDPFGMDNWGGRCTGCTAEEIANDAIELYTEPLAWQKAQEKGFEILQYKWFNEEYALEKLFQQIEMKLQTYKTEREQDLIMNILWNQQHRSTVYFSRWIELKEQAK